jgi:hypothetical protein
MLLRAACPTLELHDGPASEHTVCLPRSRHTPIARDWYPMCHYRLSLSLSQAQLTSASRAQSAPPPSTSTALAYCLPSSLVPSLKRASLQAKCAACLKSLGLFLPITQTRNLCTMAPTGSCIAKLAERNSAILFEGWSKPGRR